MGNFATARAFALILSLVSWAGAEAATTLPPKLGYTFYVRGQRVGQADVRITERKDVLRIESKLRVAAGESSIELWTKTEADPRTYAVRSFWYQGSKGGMPVSASVTVLGDSVYGMVTMGDTKTPHARRVTPTPVAVWEDWVMDLEILLGLEQAREFKNPMTRGLLLAGSYSTAKVTLGFTGEVAVEAGNRSTVARKLVVSIEGGQPFESLIDPERGIPVYIGFPGIGAEVFLNDFFGDNPASRLQPASGTSSGR
jgi:hypothetical protein